MYGGCTEWYLRTVGPTLRSLKYTGTHRCAPADYCAVTNHYCHDGLWYPDPGTCDDSEATFSIPFLSYNLPNFLYLYSLPPSSPYLNSLLLGVDSSR
jgi:hypothetical protein